MRPSNGQNANSGGVTVVWQLADCNAGDVVMFGVGPPHKHRAHAGAIAKLKNAIVLVIPPEIQK